MNITESEVRQALDVLEESIHYTTTTAWSPSITRECRDAIATLKEALARPSPAVKFKPFVVTIPIGVVSGILGDICTIQLQGYSVRKGDKLYASPPVVTGATQPDDRLLQDEPGKDARKLSKHLAGKLDARHVVDQNFKDPS